jgi:hypothetical protein
MRKESKTQPEGNQRQGGRETKPFEERLEVNFMTFLQFVTMRAEDVDLRFTRPLSRFEGAAAPGRRTLRSIFSEQVDSGWQSRRIHPFPPGYALSTKICSIADISGKGK